MQPDNINPYASPASVDAPRSGMAPRESQARRYVHRAVAILLAPGLVNGVLIAAGAGRLFPVAAIANLVFVVAAAACLWLFGNRALSIVGLMFYGVFGGPLSRQTWLARMHESLWPLPWAAGAGAAIWFAWLVLFFGPGYLSLPGTVALGTLAHVAAAWVYLTVFAGWYRLRREAPR